MPQTISQSRFEKRTGHMADSIGSGKVVPSTSASIVEAMIREPIIQSLKAGSDLRLEPVDPVHADPIFRLVDGDRARLGARLPWVEGTRTPADTLAFIEDSMRRRENPGSGDWAIIAIIEDQPTIVGVIGLHELDRAHRRTAIGYWIAGDHEGRGFITRAGSAVIDHLFAVGFHRIELRVATDNDRSLAVAERLGLRFEGVSRGVEHLNGRWIDHAVHARLDTD
ncbi:MAG: hypothetical protein CMJ34_00975 [Phycisphaerae bacterium]|nr:hypothetical protein [Phycisphaerae bacterium]